MAEADNLICPGVCKTAEKRGGKFAVDHNVVVVDVGAARKQPGESRCGEITTTFCSSQALLDVFEM